MLPSPDEKLQARLFATLLKVGELKPVEVPGGRSVDDVLRQHCGFISPPLRAAISRANSKLEFPAKDESRIVNLPPCPYWRFETSVDVSGVVEIQRVLRLRTGFAGNATVKAVAIRNPSTMTPDGRLTSDRRTIVLPYTVKAFSFFLKPGAGTPEQVAKMLAREFPSLLRDSFVNNYVSTGAGAQFSVNRIIPVTAIENCPPGTGAWPFDAARIFSVLTENAKAFDFDFVRQRAVVLVADTGIAEADKDSFPLWRNPGETGPGTRPDEDNDLNEYGYDVHGANMNREPGFPAAIESFIDADHGTQVIGILAGPWAGPDLGKLIRDRLRIALANVVDTQVNPPDESGARTFFAYIPASGVEGAFSYAERTRPTILNVSLKSGTPFHSIRDYLRGSQYLSILAAGNDGEPIDMKKKEVYPVEYRRDLKEKVITVAAHDGFGKLPKFSNRGRQVVDLAAPGCSLNTVTFAGKPVRSSGTSLAAPLVSLTAALLYSEGIHDSLKLRNRIIASADFDPDLKPFVYSASRLNMEKALRIFQDTIVPIGADGKPAKPKFGTITIAEPFAMCQDTTWSLSDVVKIIPNYQAGNEPMLVLRRVGGTNKGAYQYCAAATDVEFDFLDIETNQSTRHKLAEIHELIPQHR